MKDKIKNILCLLIVVIAAIAYITCACLPSMEELKAMRSRPKITVCEQI